MAASLVVGSKVKEVIKEMDLMMSGDSIEAVNAKVEALVKAAAERAKANGRKTVKPQDF